MAFHTPGHKWGKWDITELSYSDNLCAPRGCIAQAEADVSDILGSEKSFLLTDGSTSGVLAMLYAAKALGVGKIALLDKSHKSAFNGCKILGITPLVYTAKEREGIVFPPTMSELKENFSKILEDADALFVTSPNYYGNVADLKEIRAYCDQTGKLLLIDGAHGGHLRFNKDLYAGSYADMWVDGAHKSLPALTQGAVVSARTEKFAEVLREGVEIFRTTSPSYPIMASVEYAIKYSRNEKLERAARAFANGCERAYLGEDWTKLCILFGKNSFSAKKQLEKQGIYAEFCDGEIIMFYLSPATTLRNFKRLVSALKKLFELYPYEKTERIERDPAPLVFPANGKTEWREISLSVGEICAGSCGLFPPCTPLIATGERITAEKIRLLSSAANVYGLNDGKILIYSEEEK